MSFREQLAIDAESVFMNTDEFASTGTFTQKSTGTTVPNILFIAEINQADTLQEYGVSATAVVRILTKDIPTPRRYDTVEGDGVVYTLRERINIDDDMAAFNADFEERYNPNA